jgi:hypothetical protein
VIKGESTYIYSKELDTQIYTKKEHFPTTLSLSGNTDSSLKSVVFGSAASVFPGNIEKYKLSDF